MKRTREYLVVIAILMAGAVAIQMWRDRGWKPYEPTHPLMWLQAGPSISRTMLGFDSLASDLYWIRSVVYFGQQRLSAKQGRDYGLLYPMLDLVTRLDPRFVAAFRFGAIFLSEPPPDGPGRPDQAIALLERAVEHSPETWEYLHDVGFIYYWHYRDFAKGAEWLTRASRIPGAPFWLKSTAANMYTERGDRDSARMLWRQVGEASDNEILKQTAELRLAQFTAMDAIDELNAIVAAFRARAGRMPQDWRELVAARLLRGIPLDPTGVPFEIDAVNETVRVAEGSSLSPMPQGFTVTPRR